MRSFLLTMLANALWQAALVAAVASVAAWLVRRAPARHRYVVWVATLVVAVILPAAGAWRVLQQSSAERNGTVTSVAAKGGGAAYGAVSPWLAVAAAPEPTLPVAPVVAWIVLAGYAAFLVVGITRFFRRLRAAWRLRAAAVACRLPESVERAAERCRLELGLPPTPILVSWSLAVPSTVGAVRPVVVLPAALLAERDPDVLVTAIGHELAHVRRRDYVVHLACELLAIPFAFHPAVALVRRRIRQARELACDERVTERLLAGRSYARSLVEIARTAPAVAAAGHSLGVFDADILEERVMRLIDERPRASARAGRILVLAAALALAVTGAVAATHSVALSAAQAPERALVGSWSLFITHDGAAKSDEGEGGMPALLVLDFDGSKLSGTATIWPSRHVENGKLVGDDDKKVVFPVLDPTFDGTTFAFKVFNGEENLLGELVRHGEGFEGRWLSSKSKLSGTLKMVRK